MKDQTNAELVAVFQTTDAGLLPLAELALREAEIEFAVRRLSTDIRRPYGVAVSDFGNPLDAAEIVVGPDDANRARDVLSDLQGESAVVPPGEEGLRDGARVREADAAAAPESLAPAGAPDVQVSDAETGARIGLITRPQLQTLIDLLEEESDTSHDYYIDGATIEMLADKRADPALITLLQQALGARTGMEIRWRRD
jgi:hypothetical protein